MNIPTSHQVIRHEGVPVAVVVPYADYERAFSLGPTIPHEVIGLAIGKSMIQAWREYLGLTQQEVAERMGISQPAFSKLEAADATPRLSSIRRVAEALGVDVRQLTLE